MRVILTKTSRDDLRKIASDILPYDPHRAREVVDRLRRMAAGIGDFPERFQELPDRPGSGLRRRVVGRYLIIYRISRGRVVIDHFFHGARDLKLLTFRG